jgi:hypothetical protein
VVDLRRKNILGWKIKRLQANGIGVGPPAAAVQKKLIAKKIGKPRVAGTVLILKDE